MGQIPILAQGDVRQMPRGSHIQLIENRSLNAEIAIGDFDFPWPQGRHHADRSACHVLVDTILWQQG